MDRRDQPPKDIYGEPKKYRPDILMNAHNAWQSLATWRKEIRRNEEFVYGDQHSDKLMDYADGRVKTERQMFVDQGLQPSQYNIIRNVMRTIVGFWGSNKTKPTVIAKKDDAQYESDVLTATLHAIYDKNELWKFDMSELTKMLVSGLANSKNTFTSRNGDMDVKNDYVDPFTFFVDNSMKDPRYGDCGLVGCFYDLPVDSIAGAFCGGSRKREREIRDIYFDTTRERAMQIVETFTDARVEPDFFTPPVQNFGLGRVIEVWVKEQAGCFWVHDYLKGTYYPDFESTEADLRSMLAAREREQRAMGVAPDDMLLFDWTWSNEDFWKYYYLSPYGDVLQEGVNPFWHEQNPFTFELHEFYVGKIYPFVKDLIDANKQINKLSAMSELLTRYSAKSLMFMPVEGIDEERGYDLEYLERKATSYDAIIPYKSNSGLNKPEFVSTVSQAFTPLNVVNMYLKLSEQVSGVFGALQGQQPAAGTPAQSFLQQSQNSATSLVGVFEAINSFRTRRDKMNVQLMQQFYNEKRFIYDKDSGRRLTYDPERVKNIDFEISIVENTNTPAYRMMVNDVLMQLKQFDVNNTLDLRGLVEVGNWPFKDKLLDYLNSREQEMREAMQQPGAPIPTAELPQELASEIGQYRFSPEVEKELGQIA